MNASDYRRKAREYLKGKWPTAILSALIYTAIISGINEITLISKESVLTTIISILATILYWIIMPVLSRGLREVYYRLKKGEEVKAFDFLKFGLRSFKRFWGLTWNTFLKLIWYIVAIIGLLIIFYITCGATILSWIFAFYSDGTVSEITALGGLGFIYLGIIIMIAVIVIYVFAIIKNLYYVLTTYIGLDNYNLTTKEAVNKSEEIMKGNRGKYFCLILSFIGWYILAFIVGGFLKNIIPNMFLVSNLLSVIGTIIISPYMNMSIIAFYENLIGTNNIETDKIEK